MPRPVNNSDELLLVHIDMATRKAEHDPLLPRPRKGAWKVGLLWLVVLALIITVVVMENMT